MNSAVISPDNTSHRDRISSVTESGSRKWVYAQKPKKGVFYRIRNFLSYGYFALFFTLPFIQVNGMQWLQLNFLEGRFVLFGQIFWPQDFFIFAVGMITAIISVALFTVVYGRLFCGWICPQTVFMEMLFRKIEWWLEGSSNQQQATDKGKLNAKQLALKVTKHILFISLAFLIANTFLAYIIGTKGLAKIISEPLGEHLVLFSGLLVFTGLFYSVFAFVREIVCTTICPFGRLQSVLVDKNSMMLTYDYNRGEPRTKFSKNRAPEAGSCVDCKKCVQVCPMGIDIRNGMQMECTGCTACIDACDSVMDELNFKRGLISYTSEQQIVSKSKFVLNGRAKAYTALLAALLIFMGYLVASRRNIDTYVSRARGQLYTEIQPNIYRNLYVAKVINKTNQKHTITLHLENVKGEIELVGEKNYELQSEKINPFTFFITLPKAELKKHSTPVIIGIYEDGKKIQTLKTNFLGPFI